MLHVTREYNPQGDDMKTSIASRVQKHRESQRAKGLKLIQIWVPNTHSKGFAKECKRQALLAKSAEHELELNDFIEKSADLRGWE